MAGQKIQWSCLSRVTGINEEITRLMKEAGCRRVYLGLETGNQDTLKLMNKKATLEEGRNAVQLFHEAGIEVAAFFIVGYPGKRFRQSRTPSGLPWTCRWMRFPSMFPSPCRAPELFERVSKVDKNKDWNKENEVTFVYEFGVRSSLAAAPDRARPCRPLRKRKSNYSSIPDAWITAGLFNGV